MRPKTKGRPGKISPAASRLLHSRPPLRDSTKVMRDSKSKAKPSEGTPQGPVDRGFAADYFGASPVASASNLPQGRDSPENRNQTITHPPPARSKPDISTLQRIGHFYFALTAKGSAQRAPPPSEKGLDAGFALQIFFHDERPHFYKLFFTSAATGKTTFPGSA
jgi:hypothetical protein